MDESILQKSQPANQPDIANILRFLLPKIGTSLGANRLLSLICLDWANTELALGLEFETLWKDELTSSNFILFFCGCFVSNAPDGEVNVADIEDLVIPAMQSVDSSNKAQLSGRARFHEIVTTVLKTGRTLDWVSVCEGSITRLTTSGPDEKLLEHCRLEDVRLQQNRSDRGIEEVPVNQIEKVLTSLKCQCEIPWLISNRAMRNLGPLGRMITKMRITMMMAIAIIET